MIEKFKTLFFVKSSLISLYLALTIPIPFIAIDKLKIPSISIFLLGLFLIINITSDHVETCNNKISYKTSFISKALGRKNWEISWKDIRIDVKEISYISPLWTYKLLTTLSVLMIIGEIYAFVI